MAVAVMRNHIHMVLGVSGDPEPEHLKKDVKAYASRRMNRQFGRREEGTWWTTGGSVRKLANEESLAAAIEYVRNQENPLLVWINPEVDGMHPGD